MMGVLLRRHLTPIKDIFQQLPLVWLHRVWLLQTKVLSLLWDGVNVCRDEPCLSKEGRERLYHSPQMWDVGLTPSLRSSHLAESRVPFSAARGLRSLGKRELGFLNSSLPNPWCLGHWTGV